MEKKRRKSEINLILFQIFVQAIEKKRQKSEIKHGIFHGPSPNYK